jgi:hypothetical protein
MAVCLICCDGAADNRHLSILCRWGIGCTVAYYRDDDTNKKPLHSYDDSLSGWNRKSQRSVMDHRCGGSREVKVPIIEIKNDIAVVETLGIARAFWLAAHNVSDNVKVVIACDRMASIKTLENLEGRKIRGRFAFAYALRRLRADIISALQKHGCIELYYHQELGFDENWRADVLSRHGVDDCILPSDTEDLLSFRINYDADKQRRLSESGEQFVYQKLSLE